MKNDVAQQQTKHGSLKYLRIFLRYGFYFIFNMAALGQWPPWSVYTVSPLDNVR